jgi:hypothetical protein
VAEPRRRGCHPRVARLSPDDPGVGAHMSHGIAVIETGRTIQAGIADAIVRPPIYGLTKRRGHRGLTTPEAGVQ